MSCCNPCNPCSPCCTVETTFPRFITGANLSVSAIYIGAYAPRIFQNSSPETTSGPISAVYQGATVSNGTLSGGGGGVLCCCPNNLIMASQANFSISDRISGYYGNVTVPLCGNNTAVRGTFYNPNTPSLIITLTGIAQVTCCNGVKAVNITSLNYAA